MKNNMYAMVLFILVITTATISSVLCSSAPNDINDEKEILMVVEEHVSSMKQPGMAQNPVQPERFSLRSGRSVTLPWVVKGRENTCVPPGGTCGAADWCCEGSSCEGTWKFFSGTCVALPNCVKEKGGWCNLGNRCCYPYQCSWPKDGECQ